MNLSTTRNPCPKKKLNQPDPHQSTLHKNLAFTSRPIKNSMNPEIKPHPSMKNASPARGARAGR